MKTHIIVKKTDLISAVGGIRVTVKPEGHGTCTITVKNKSKIKVTNMCIDCYGYNKKGEVDRAIGVWGNEFAKNGLEPGKIYTCKVGGPDSNWETFFGDGKPDQVVVTCADNSQ